LLMAYANFKIREKTNSSSLITLAAIFSLLAGTLFIFYYVFTHEPEQMVFILVLYIVLALGAYFYARLNRTETRQRYPEPN
jgi:predicted membrane channel-forming protein YqfA (hemolysin III family)